MRKKSMSRLSHPPYCPGARRKGFALIAALGALAALFILVVAVDSAIQMNRLQAGRNVTTANDMAGAEAAARIAMRQTAGGGAGSMPASGAQTLGGMKYDVKFQKVEESDELYKTSGLGRRSGDERVEVEWTARGREQRANWLANPTPGSERMILLEQVR